MSYAVQVDLIERRVLADRTGALVAAALAGTDKVTVPDPDEMLARFDAALAELPTVHDPGMRELRWALGV